MKLGKITAFITAIVAVLTTFSFLTPAMLTKAEGESATEYTSTDKYVYAYSSYDSNFIFGNLVKGVAETDKVNYELNKYTFSYKPVFDTTDEGLQAKLEAYLGKKVDEIDGEKTLKLSDLQAMAEERLGAKDITVATTNNELSEKGSKTDVVFNYVGGYQATVKATAKTVAEGEESAKTKEFVVNFEVVETPSARELNPEYNLETGAIKAYAAAIKSAIKDGDKDVEFGKDFTLPDMSEFIDCNYYPVKDVKLTMFYRTPSSESFSKNEVSTSTSSKEFELNAHGKYTFYVALRDPFGKNTEVVSLNDYTYEKRDGDDKAYYYKDDEKMYYLAPVTLEAEEGDPDYAGIIVEMLMDAKTKTEVYPMFSFEYYGTKEPSVILVQSEGQTHKAYQGLTYTNVSHLISVEIVSEGQTEYRLYYSKNHIDKNELDFVNAKEYKKGEDGLMDITDVEEFEFDKSSKNFMVAEKGYYYVNCTVGNEFGNTEGYVVIDGNNSFTKINYARDFGKDFSNFVKNNTVSVVFAGIALLSFVGLMLVIFIKPKEANVEESVEPVSKD